MDERPMMDVDAEARAIERSVGQRSMPAGEAHTVALQRTYDAPVEEVWDALTDPQRIVRWFLPITGDLRLGGTYQLEGNAGGKILRCEPPHSLLVTWAMGEDPAPARWRCASLPPGRGRPCSGWTTPRWCRRRCGPSTARGRWGSAGTWGWWV